MSYEAEVDSVFTKAENQDYAQQIVNFVAERFGNPPVHLSKIPDIRFSNAGGIFLRMQKSCAVDFFLERDKEYEHLKCTTPKATHTHGINGTNVKQLMDSDFDVLKHYIELSYSTVKNR